MKIVHILKVKGVTGAENFVRHLCIGLCKSFEVHVIVLEKPDHPADEFCTSLKNAGITVHRIALQNLWSIATACQVMQVMRRERFDIIHSHLMAGDIYAGLAKLLMRHTKWIATVHNVHSFASMKKPVLWTYRFILSRVNQLVYPSQFQKKNLAYLFAKIPDRIIPFGLPHRPRSNAAHDDVQILFLGRLIKLKGVHELLAAFLMIEVDFPSAKLIFVGDGEERSALQKQVHAKNLDDRVIFHGYQKDIGPYYEQATFFVLPSHSEGLPLALLEAMSAGIAIIATQVTSIPECVVNEKSALLVPAGNAQDLAAAMRRLLNEPGLRSTLAHAAQAEFIQRFTQDKMLESYTQLYRS